MMTVFKRKDLIVGAVLLLLSISSQVSARLAVMSIDLGGEFMKIAIVKPGVPMEIVLNKDSARKTPTLVAFRDGDRHFSNDALSTAVKFPQKAFSYLSEVIGHNYDDSQVLRYRERFPYHTLIKDEDRGTVVFQLEDETKYSPEELLGMILEKAREYAKGFAEQDIKDAVITVPAFYNQAERRAVLAAANLVGINVLQLMSDNAAVALNYGVFRRKNFNTTMQYYMFYDMGATSTTATIVGYNVVKTKEGTFMESNPQLTIKGVGFDRSLGGIEFSLRLRDHLAKTFNNQKKTSTKVESNPRAMAKLLKEAERVKKVLSANTEHHAQIEGLLDEKDFSAVVSRAEFEAMNEDLLARVTKPVEEALKVSEFTLSEISEVILMGGGTRLPKVQELLMKYVDRTELGKSINTDEAAAMGAVYQAAYLGKGFKVKKFGVREGNIYPINVEFEKQKSSDGDEKSKLIKRTLFGRMNPYPQKKVMTFNKHTKDFDFNVLYGNLDFLTEEEKQSFGSQMIASCHLEGVEDALGKHKDSADSKGIKAHFKMDENGILSLDRVESVFERNASQQAEAEKSTWSKLGSAIGGFFSGGSTDDGEAKIEDKPDGTADGGGATDSSNSNKDGSTDQEGPSATTPPPDTDGKTQQGTQQKEEMPSPEQDATKEEKSTETTNEEKEKDEKSQEKTGQEEGDKKESAEKTDESEPKKANDSKAEQDKDGKKKEEAKTNATKVTTLKEEIKSQVQVLDIKDMTADQLAASKKKLSDLQAQDREKRQLEKVKNELEAFIFDLQDKLESGGSHTECASEDEKTNLLQSLSEASDWLYEQGDDTKKEEYSAKLKSLTDSTKDLAKRVFELEERPRALEALKNVLNQTNIFLETVKNMSDLEDPIFTEVEITTLEKLINESLQWRAQKLTEQSKLQPYENPVLLSEEIATKIGALDREMRYLINKAKNFRPKPKPKPKDDNKTEGNETSSTQETADESNETKTETPEETQEDSSSEAEDKGPTADLPGSEGDSTSTGKRRPKSKRKPSEPKQEKEEEEVLELDGATSDQDKKEETKENDDSKADEKDDNNNGNHEKQEL